MSKRKRAEVEPTVNTGALSGLMAGTPCRVTHSQSKGNGLFLERALPGGEIVLKDAPLCWKPRGHVHSTPGNCVMCGAFLGSTGEQLKRLGADVTTNVPFLNGQPRWTRTLQGPTGPVCSRSCGQQASAHQRPCVAGFSGPASHFAQARKITDTCQVLAASRASLSPIKHRKTS